MLFGRLKDKRPCGEAVKNMDSEFRLHDFLAALTWPANNLLLPPCKINTKMLRAAPGEK